MSEPEFSSDWVEDCMHWRVDWDGLPIDETCPEWPCVCAENLIEMGEDRAKP